MKDENNENKADLKTPPETLKDDLHQKVEKAEQEAKDNYNKWLYLYADFENYKKRIVKEKADLIKYGNEILTRELLEVVDSLEKSLSHMTGSKDVKGFEEGIQLTLKQFLVVLSKFGIIPIESKGKKFDPRFHEALAEKEDKNLESGMILEEHQKGYKYHDKILRVAKVIVVKNKDNKKEEEMKGE